MVVVGMAATSARCVCCPTRRRASPELIARPSPPARRPARASDPDVHRLYAETRQRRRADQRTLVEVLHRHGHLRSGLDLDEAADTFYALVNEETYSMLTGDCGWTRDRFRQWLEQTVRRVMAGSSP
jgi:hypothetical protein